MLRTSQLALPQAGAPAPVASRRNGPPLGCPHSLSPVSLPHLFSASLHSTLVKQGGYFHLLSLLL